MNSNVGKRQGLLEPLRQEWFEAACANIDAQRMRTFNRKVTGIHSPTGSERALAEYLAEYLRDQGVDSRYQPMGETSGNIHATLRGLKNGPSLLLYSPIDTHLDADESDVPWIGPEQRRDMRPAQSRPGDDSQEEFVIGLGAANPKAMVTTLMEAFLAIKNSNIPLSGDLTLGFAGGGMPWNASQRGNRGLSDGAFHLLTRGVCADFAVVMKPYNYVYHEEPGLCWFKVRVHGTLGYAGMARGRQGFESSIVPAARLILQLEDWLKQYAINNRAGQIAPQGWLSALRAGWPDKPAFPSAATDIYLDVRCHPATSPAQVKAQFNAAMEKILAANLDIKADWEMCAAYPGASTDPENWIIQSSVRAWEEVENREMGDTPPISGQTDISTLRNLHIPTARIGWSATPVDLPDEFKEGLGGMGVSYTPDLVPACRKILYAIIDTCTRTRMEVGLEDSHLADRN